MQPMSAREPNPYAPPLDEPDVPKAGPNGDPGAISCTVRLEVDDMAEALRVQIGKIRWVTPVLFGVMGLVSGAAMGATWQIVQALGLGTLGWMLWPLLYRASARRALANKSDAERTVTFVLSPESVEVTTPNTYSRTKWPGVHRFVESPNTFLLYLSEAMAQVIPKRALRSHEVDALRAMFTSHVAPRKKAPGLGRVVALWFLLLVLFLAVWQFLQPDR
jgi:hypothetical protein